MNRTPINPWAWSLKFGFNQAELLSRQKRQLICSGQTAADAEGTPMHIGDMRGQMSLALDNLEAILTAADLNLSYIVRLNIYTTDMDETMKHGDVLGARLGAFDVAPPMTWLGVHRLALPELMFEIEATAAD